MVILKYAIFLENALIFIFIKNICYHLKKICEKVCILFRIGHFFSPKMSFLQKLAPSSHKKNNIVRDY